MAEDSFNDNNEGNNEQDGPVCPDCNDTNDISDNTESSSCNIIDINSQSDSGCENSSCKCGNADTEQEAAVDAEPDAVVNAAVNAVDTASTEEELNNLKSALQKKEEEIKKLKADFIRTHADFENHKNRLIREKNEFLKYANEKLIIELLGVLDNLERAVDHADCSESKNMEKLVEGLQLVKKQFLELLKKFGLSVIDAAGQQFDPGLHDAMMQIEDPEKENNMIAQVLFNGYKLSEKVIRHSKVSVVKNKN